MDETSEGGIMPLYEVSRNYKKVDIVIDTVWYGGKRRAGGGWVLGSSPYGGHQAERGSSS